jgi:AraC-like DNA-binding protein
MPLLLDALSSTTPQPPSRLAGLLATVDAAPFAAWTASSMAARAGFSVSRLHALFREELDTTPRAWLANLRLGQVQEWLAYTSLSIAEVAYRGGFTDQSALTRAMRKATGLTPATYRRQAQESRPKLREP